MKSASSNHQAAIGEVALRHGIVERDMLWIEARDGSGDPVEFAFWTGQVPIETTVGGGFSGTPEVRTYVGGGALMGVGDIPGGLGLQVRRVQVSLNRLHGAVQSLLRNHTMGLMPAEVHRLLLDPVTHQVVDVPSCEFMGHVNLASDNRPAAGNSGELTIDIVSDTREVTRTNPARVSDEWLKRRAPGDAGLKYVSTVQHWSVPWGDVDTRT